MNSVENVCEYYSHFKDDFPINIFAVGESFWYEDCFFERVTSEITAIEYVVSGYGVLENNGKKYDIGPKDVFLLRKGTHHKYYNAKHSTLHKIFITLTGELPEILLNQYLPGHDYVYHNCELEELFRNIYKKTQKYGTDYSDLVDDMVPEIMKLIIAISHCASNDKKCIFNDDITNVLIEKAKQADGFIFGSAVHYAAPSGTICAVLDRAFYAGSSSFCYKPGAAILSCRRAGSTAAFDVLNKYFTISNMPVVSSGYWNMVHGAKAEDVLKDEEGLQIMRTLAKNMAWILKCIENGKTNGIVRPEAEAKIRTNFIR